MTYQQTLEYLYSRLPMYQRVGKVAYKNNLDNTIRLLESIGNPHRKFKSVHIAGTNGKGTSAHGIASILQVAGYKTGLYTSPHLKHFTERIRINGKEIEGDSVVDFTERIKSSIEKLEPSFFEITVAMAFDYFAQMKVDIAVIETGLGGRLDSTNVILPEVSLITNIGYDHMEILGDTLEMIALEKAGIIKSQIPVVIGEKQPETKAIFERRANEVDAPLSFPTDDQWKPSSSIIPNYLIKNYAGIKGVIDQLIIQDWKISNQQIQEGMNNINSLTGLKGRMQVLDNEPLIIADISHNVDGLRILFEQVSELNKGKLHLVFGTVIDKDLAPIFELFPKNASIYWTQSSVPRALKVEELAIQAIVRGLQGGCFKNVNEAIRDARENALPEDLILVTGSTFVIGEIDNL